MNEHGGGSRQDYNVTFALLALAAVSYALLQSLVAPALPDIQRSLGASVNSASWVLTAYLLSASIATPIIGRLGDMYGKARLLVVVLILLCGATAISALATSLTVMVKDFAAAMSPSEPATARTMPTSIRTPSAQPTPRC